MINIMYTVDPIKRIAKPMSGHAVTEQDHEASSLRFAFPDNIPGTGLDSTGTAVRVMYIRPDGGDPVAKTLTFYKHSGGYYLYDWDLQKSDLQKEGHLVFSLCILDISGGEVSEWHTTPCQIRVLDTIHTDDSDEADETITPTVAQRVAVLETMIQRVASGAPIVVASTSAMTDTNQIYVLSTNGRWYYHNGTAWVAGGEYGGVAAGSITTDKLADGAVTTAKIADGAITAGKLTSDAVPTDTTLTQSGIPADAKAVGDKVNVISAISRQTAKQFDSYTFSDMSDTYKTVITDIYMEAGETVNIHVTETSNANAKVQGSSDSPTALGTVGGYTYTASSAGYLRFYYKRIYCTLTFSDYRITNESGNSEYLLTTQKAVKDVDDKANSLKSEQTGIISRLEAVDGIRTVPFEMGTVDIIGNTMSKRDAANRMRSVSPVPLYSGDTLTADEGYEFYLDKYVDNTWRDLVSWRTSYTVTDDGDYEIVVRLTDNSDITDTDEASESVNFSNNPNSALSAISANAENIDELFEKIGYKQFVDFTNGYYIAGSVGGSVDIRIAAACSYSTTPLFAEVGQVVHCKTQGTGLACISVSKTNNISNAICVVAGSNNTGIVEATYEMQSDGYVWVSARTAVLEAWIETPKSTELITKVNSLTTKTDDLLSEVFDCNGTAIVRNIDFPSGGAYIELMRVNLKAGVAYTFSATIEKMQTANVYAYFYITNNSGVNIGGGSLFGIKSNTETSNTFSVTRTFDTSYDNAVFRVKCSIEGTVESAEITYTKTDSVNAIPDYYYADNYLPNKVSRINTLALEAGSSGDVFIFITDMHWNSNAKHSPELIKYIVERSQIYRLFDGGDDENGGRPDLAKKLRECMGGGKAYFTMGNHEYVGAVGSELYYMYDGANNDQIGNPERHYYYVDDVQVKTRYIVMSAFRENGSGSNMIGYEADQITWLTTVALNVNSGWHIIIFSHCVYTSQRLGTEWILPAWAEPFVNAIDSYSGNGKIVCVFQGDHHADGINYTPNGIPVIATSCDKYQHWMVDGADMEPYLNDRIGNTVWEQSFDVVIHNKTTKTIYCVRIGGFANLTGGNEALFEAGERVVTYT